ncbi:hypothetical protein D6858_07860 [Tsuneonella suprasediminis]|uniref:Uncharacterized protein n=1 Tax=Tsuneonella suprasediminis TaxID=2306996 RepID=A0A419R1T0_9SPHN|nr:hypothetical protein [Tsuneonella suprasediminis]RJX67871.1 hypothetical protein D6858_07860 [Tsuneonella suprasediminis]
MIRPANPPRRATMAAAALALIICAVPAVPVAQESDGAEYLFECGAALNVSESKGIKLPISSKFATDHFVKETGGSEEVQERADAEVRRTWTRIRKEKGQAGLEAYVLGTARDCSDLYQELAARKAGTYKPGARNAATRQASAQAPQQAPKQAPKQASAPMQLNSLGTLSAASLRAHVAKTGDYAAVADYLVYHYPYGKDLFKPNEDGDYLGEIIAQIGAKGVRSFSDEAIYAIAYKHYWQYNPPASRIIEAEYTRRLRAKRQSVDEGRRWAERAAADRAQKARQANARPVGSIGRHCEKNYRPAEPGSPGAWVTKCW